MWRGGCIIRSVFLEKIKEAYTKKPDLQNLLLDDYFKKVIDNCQDSWRKVIAASALHGIPVPAFGAALAFFDGYRNAVLPANLLQAQRDYFGTHTYERIDKPRGQFLSYKLDWHWWKCFFWYVYCVKSRLNIHSLCIIYSSAAVRTS